MAEPQSKLQQGTFCWTELATTDTEAAEKFYCELLGWTCKISDIGDTTYTIFSAGTTEVGGMFKMEGEQWQGICPHWMSYITVDDIKASTEKAVKLGASIKVPPTDIPTVGCFCVIQDPTGAVISLFQQKTI